MKIAQFKQNHIIANWVWKFHFLPAREVVLRLPQNPNLGGEL